MPKEPWEVVQEVADTSMCYRSQASHDVWIKTMTQRANLLQEYETLCGKVRHRLRMCMASPYKVDCQACLKLMPHAQT